MYVGHWFKFQIRMIQNEDELLALQLNGKNIPL